uniref:Retrovirus-related Pol polyprotein from transposon TNT 1-94 n=1 Tax=Cajanus cajan TaxID=3821 RepID=A0A151R858_CAJCA|nr:Retrovirus-related Pol polyprotein from transposon TNT 1-94 [Cajanus cajan]
MTYDEELFKELDRTIVSKVRISNGKCIAVKGKGTIVIESCSGTKIITDVLYVPEINQNLLSVGQLLEKGYKILFEDKMCLIKDVSGYDLFKVKMKGKNFSLDLMEEVQAAVSSTINVTELWHKRMGHFNHVALLNMKKDNIVEGLASLESDLNNCNACKYGKQYRLPFPQTSWRASQKLQLIHTNLGGPLPKLSLNGSKYYILFIDDLTRMCWIYFLKFTSEVVGIFWRFKAWIENQSGCKIQVLRSNNGKEYISDQFNSFCEEVGIEHQLTTPYTPQQNGVSERKNRTIMEMARSMMHEKGLPKKFWAEAANTVVFLLNRLPTKVVPGKTPYEAWYGYKPFVQNFKVFACICFTYVPKVKRDKLDKRVEARIFIDYSTPSKAYRVYQPQTGKILISRDVCFVEDKQWNWEKDDWKQVPNFSFIKEKDEIFDENVDDPPVRRTRLLSYIYERCNVAILEPANFFEVEKDPKWIVAMHEEFCMIEKNQTWELVSRPQHQNFISVKWVFRTKLNADGSINKHKVRLVVKGYTKKYGVNFFETFAPVARLDTIILVLAFAAQNGLECVSTRCKFFFSKWLFRRGDIYIEQPEGFVVKGQEDKVYLLKKALYGLK